MKQPTMSSTSHYEVPFFDVDAYRVVWHGNYPKYCEIARCQLLEMLGIPYSKMEQENYFYPVVEMDIKYIKPLVFGQKIDIVATLVEWENRLVIKYQILDATTGAVCTKAKTKQVAIAMPNNITQFVAPKFITDNINAWLNEKGSDELPQS